MRYSYINNYGIYHLVFNGTVIADFRDAETVKQIVDALNRIETT